MEKVSIIIPTVNSPWLEEILNKLNKQTYSLENVEILVIGLDEIGITHTKNWVTFIDTGQKTPPAIVRNMGIQHATGDIICFLDDDCLPQPTWLENMLKPYQHGAKVVGGGITFPTDSYWTVCDSVAHFWDVLAETPPGERAYLPSLNLSVHRSVFEAVGGFNENFPKPAGEDTELTYRIRQAGYTLHFRPDATIFHAARRNSALDVWRRAWNFGQAVAVHPALQSLLHASPFFRYWLVMIFTALPSAFIAAVKIFKRYPPVLKYKAIFLGLVMSKLAWQLGAAFALRQSTSPT